MSKGLTWEGKNAKPPSVIKEALLDTNNEATKLKILSGIPESSIKLYKQNQPNRTVETRFMDIHMGVIFCTVFLEKGFTEYFNYSLL